LKASHLDFKRREPCMCNFLMPFVVPGIRDISRMFEDTRLLIGVIYKCLGNGVLFIFVVDCFPYLDEIFCHFRAFVRYTLFRLSDSYRWVNFGLVYMLLAYCINCGCQYFNRF